MVMQGESSGSFRFHQGQSEVSQINRIAYPLRARVGNGDVVGRAAAMPGRSGVKYSPFCVKNRAFWAEPRIPTFVTELTPVLRELDFKVPNPLDLLL